MVIKKDTYLPTFKDLETEEITLSGHVLHAAAPYFGKYCEYECNEFMLCRAETKDMRKCFELGKDVTNCGLHFFRLMKKMCHDELDRYSFCLDQSSGDLNYEKCRNTQAEFDKCVYKNLGIERPHWAYFTRPRAFNSKIRPPPEPEKPLVFEGTPKSPLDPGFPEPAPARYGWRLWFWR